MDKSKELKHKDLKYETDAYIKTAEKINGKYIIDKLKYIIHNTHFVGKGLIEEKENEEDSKKKMLNKSIEGLKLLEENRLQNLSNTSLLVMGSRKLQAVVLSLLFLKYIASDDFKTFYLDSYFTDTTCAYNNTENPNTPTNLTLACLGGVIEQIYYSLKSGATVEITKMDDNNDDKIFYEKLIEILTPIEIGKLILDWLKYNDKILSPKQFNSLPRDKEKRKELLIDHLKQILVKKEMKEEDKTKIEEEINDNVNLFDLADGDFIARDGSIDDHIKKWIEAHNLTDFKENFDALKDETNRKSKLREYLNNVGFIKNDIEEKIMNLSLKDDIFNKKYGGRKKIILKKIKKSLKKENVKKVSTKKMLKKVSTKKMLKKVSTKKTFKVYSKR